MRFSRNLVVTMFVLLFPFVAVSDSDLIKRMEGYYLVPSQYCSELDGSALKPCDPVPHDCLLIRKIDDSHAQVNVYSVQTNGHQCEAAGIAQRVGDKLLFTEQGIVGHGSQFEIAIVGKSIKLRYPVDPGLGIPAFCGARGRIDRLEFPLKVAKPTTNHTCGEIDN